DNWGTGEIQEYTANPDNLQLDGSGNLTITPRRDGSGNWTSARIETQRKDFKPPSGGVLAIEARISLPNVSGRQALGYWPAFWALGGPYRGNYWNWPAIGEFDILENVNGINQAWGGLHGGVQQGGPCNETEGIGDSTEGPGSPWQGNFHTYRFEWDSGADELCGCAGLGQLHPRRVRVGVWRRRAALVRRRSAGPHGPQGAERRPGVDRHGVARGLLRAAQRRDGRCIPQRCRGRRDSGGPDRAG